MIDQYTAGTRESRISTNLGNPTCTRKEHTSIVNSLYREKLELQPILIPAYPAHTRLRRIQDNIILGNMFKIDAGSQDWYHRAPSDIRAVQYRDVQYRRSTIYRIYHRTLRSGTMLIPRIA